MRYHKIRKMDISNGPGVRVSIFMQGCEFHCENCFNKETHDFNGGKEFTDDTIKRVLELCENENVEGLSILGGEPFIDENLTDLEKLVKRIKETYPNKKLWIYSGFTYEELLERAKNILNYVDILVDGRYVDELKNYKLKFRGSSNQRIIDVQNSLKENKVIIYLD